MSMKQLEVGQPAWIVVEDYPFMSVEDEVEVKSLFGIESIVVYRGYEHTVYLSDLSPYPPVKAVDGWAVVLGSEIVDAGMNETLINGRVNQFNYGTDDNPYRCIHVTITAKTTTNE